MPNGRRNINNHVLPNGFLNSPKVIKLTIFRCPRMRLRRETRTLMMKKVVNIAVGDGQA